jgi:hypothetical protein
MAAGDQTDIIGRLQRWLPTRWFPTDIGTRVYATLAGFASPLSAIYSQIAYVRNQTRLGTVTDGFADLASYDYLGDRLPRLAGESDATYVARIKANIFLKANTPTAVEAAIEAVTGYPARVIEPWNPSNNARYGSAFYGFNRKSCPGQYSDGNQRYKGLIVCSLPATGAALPRRGYGGVFYTSSSSIAAGAGAFYSTALASSAEQLVFDALSRVLVFGTQAYVKFVPPGQV